VHSAIGNGDDGQGLCAGIALEGAALRQDLDGNTTTGVRAPEAAAKLLALLNRYSAKERTE